MNKVSKKASKKEVEDSDQIEKPRKKRIKKEKSDIKRAKSSYNYFTGDPIMRKKASSGGLAPKEVMGKLA